MLAWAFCLLAAAPPIWQPAETYALVASIVTWPSSSGLHGFPPEKRKDDAFVDALVAAGVKRENIVYLRDSAATLDAMRLGLAGMIKRTGPSSTLLFSFQGHGMRAKGETILANYDIDTAKPLQTAMSIGELKKGLATFKGARLLLVGDFCHSGALGEIALASKIPAASFTSATASNRSTENWTFTEALIDALNGSAGVDQNGDGSLSFAEVDRYVHDAMKFGEDQLTHAQATASFDRAFVLRRVAGRKVGEVVEVEWQKDNWFRAQITKIDEGYFHFVHYEGEAGEDDEWVTPRRMRNASAIKAKPAAARSASPRKVAVKDLVCARWRNQWYRAELLGIDGAILRVRYDDGEFGDLVVDDVLPLTRPNELKSGDSVLAGWRGAPRMYPGYVMSLTATGALIKWDDGDVPSEVELSRIARVLK